MTSIDFTVQIAAPPQKVWSCLWQDAHYRNWTSVFCEGSYAVSDWKEGSKIQFLSPGAAGMYSIIESMQEPHKMLFKHIGEIKNGEEQPVTDAQGWQDAREGYTLSFANGITTVVVTINVLETYAGYFTKTFPVALQKLKEIAEA